MKEKKYENDRPSINADIKRAIEVEAGHTCSIKDCFDHTYLEIHHINENREDNSLDNLILLCDKHHKMAHAKRIDRKALKAYKSLLNNRVLKSGQASDEEIMRARDIHNLELILFVMPLNIIYEMLEGLPRYLKDYQLDFYDYFHAKISNPNFHIYNQDLNALFNNVHSAWHGCVSHAQMYRHGPEGTYFFSNEGDTPLSKEQEVEWNKIEESRYLLKLNLDNLINKIRNDYLDIDIQTINDNGIKEYAKIKKEIQDNI